MVLLSMQIRLIPQRPKRLIPFLLFVIIIILLNASSSDGCCGGGCGCCCSYGCYRPQPVQQQVVQQQPIYIPYPVPTNNNNNNNGANAPSYRNYVNGVGSRNNNNNNNNNNNPAKSNTDQAQTNALLASLITQLQKQNSLAAANSNNNNNGDGETLASNSNPLKALQDAAAAAKASSGGSNPPSFAPGLNLQQLMALLAQAQQQNQQPPTTRKTTTTTTTTTLPPPPPQPQFDFASAFRSFFAQLPFVQPTPPTTTTTTEIPTPKPVMLSQEQLEQLRGILASIGGLPNQAPQVQRARAAPKGLAAMIAQDAAGDNGTFPGSHGFDSDEDLITDDYYVEPVMGSVHPPPSRLMTMLHMADQLDQFSSIVAGPEVAHARPISSRLVAMIDPTAVNGTEVDENDVEDDGPPPPPSRPLINVNVPIPPAERDLNIILGNYFAWENSALPLEELGKRRHRINMKDLGGFEKLSPAPLEEDEEELDEEQLHNVLMDFYYKFDTYDARDTLEHADLGDEEYEQMQKGKSSSSSSASKEKDDDDDE